MEIFSTCESMRKIHDRETSLLIKKNLFHIRLLASKQFLDFFLGLRLSFQHVQCPQVIITRFYCYSCFRVFADFALRLVYPHQHSDKGENLQVKKKFANKFQFMSHTFSAAQNDADWDAKIN